MSEVHIGHSVLTLHVTKQVDMLAVCCSVVHSPKS